MRASRATYGGAQFVRRWPDLGLPRRGAAGDSLVCGGGIPVAMGWCGLAWELCRKEGELLVKSDWTEWWWWRLARSELEFERQWWARRWCTEKRRALLFKYASWEGRGRRAGVPGRISVVGRQPGSDGVVLAALRFDSASRMACARVARKKGACREEKRWRQGASATRGGGSSSWGRGDRRRW